VVAFTAYKNNFPMVHSTYLRWQIERSGVDVIAQVTDSRQVGDEYFVVFTIPGDEQRDELEDAVAEVDEATFDDAQDTLELEVRVLPDDSGAFTVEGQVTSRVGLVITLLADLFLVTMIVLMTRFRAVMRVELVLRATGDLERCPPGTGLERISGLRYIVTGDVVEIEDDEIVLDLGDRKVRVLLDGYANPAGYQQSARAVGYMVA